jgi:arylsulfatase A-like enzyme
MEQNKMNVVIVMADQFHPKALGCMGHPVVKTPNLDRLAAENVMFTNAVTSCPLCQPARVSMLTGMYPHATQIYDNNEDKQTRPDLVSMGAYFHEQGYFTGTTGKYHAEVLTNAGFDYRINVAEYTDFLKARDKEFATDYAGPSLEEYPSPSIGCGISPLEDDETRTAFEADSALRFLEEREQEKPFFLWMNFDAPHGPYYLSRKYASMYDPEAIAAHEFDYDLLPPEQRAWTECRSYNRMTDAMLRQALAFYYGSISEVDFHFGRIIDRLKQQGIYDNTIVIFLADHGDHAGDHRIVNKGFAYDSTLKIPFMVHVPKTDVSGKYADLVQNVDIFPTLCDLLGLQKPEILQGNSFAGLLCGELRGNYSPRQYTFSDEYYYRTIRTATHKLIYAPPHLSWGDGQRFTSQLYDLEHDPDETINLYDAPEHVEVQTHLKELLLEALCASELPLRPYIRQQITTEEHVSTYGAGYEKRASSRRQTLQGKPSPIISAVYLPTAGDKGWANGG